MERFIIETIPSVTEKKETAVEVADVDGCKCANSFEQNAELRYTEARKRRKGYVVDRDDADGFRCSCLQPPLRSLLVMWRWIWIDLWSSIDAQGWTMQAACRRCTM
ncbi:unnamed protein product [Toxocara canis]|uniref:Uncharacterized protein n=1 Tax=Toxocara canis TaxID=6265 RepID=A0A183UY42_TOXCA|nr:unnamed protein product [Toxocara canis]